MAEHYDFYQWPWAALEDRFIVWNRWIEAGCAFEDTPEAISSVFNEMCTRVLGGC